MPIARTTTGSPRRHAFIAGEGLGALLAVGGAGEGAGATAPAGAFVLLVDDGDAERPSDREGRVRIR